ncbi:LysR family transcriptional regulator [Saccharomonospora sp. NPDC006951]
MRLRGLDLNLMVLLDALLAEKSVTKAARRIGLSQPTMSTALGRLRRHFSDDLLVRSGNQYELTPLAEHLRPLLSSALAGAERVFTSVPDFDPATAEREFTVLASDYGMATVGSSLHRIVAQRAPKVRLRLRSCPPGTIDRVDEHLRTVDALVLRKDVVQGLPSQDLLVDEWVAVVDADRHLVGGSATVAELSALPWVVTGSADEMPALGPRAADAVPSVAATVESFLAVPLLVRGTDRAGLVPRGIADRLTGSGEVRIVELRGEPTRFVESAVWHPVHERDAGHQWLRHCMSSVAELAGATPAATGS